MHSPRICLLTSRVGDSPADVLAEPPVVRANQLQPAYPAHTRKDLRGGCCSLRVLELPSSAFQSQRQCPEREDALCRLIAAKLATQSNLYGGPKKCITYFRLFTIHVQKQHLHSFHGAAIIEVGCGGARTRCAHPAGARTEALVRY